MWQAILVVTVALLLAAGFFTGYLFRGEQMNEWRERAGALERERGELERRVEELETRLVAPAAAPAPEPAAPRGSVVTAGERVGSPAFQEAPEPRPLVEPQVRVRTIRVNPDGSIKR